MKKLITMLLLSFGFSFATERVTVTCDFEALAEGYEDVSVYNNMLLTDRSENGVFLNADGSNKSNYQEITVDEDDGSRSIRFHAGNSFEWLVFPVCGHNHMCNKGEWNSNTGNIECTWKNGWN